jgi:ferredoxin
MSVLRGAGSLQPPSRHEAAVLARNGAGADERLSCQCSMPAVAVDLLVTTGYW